MFKAPRDPETLADLDPTLKSWIDNATYAELLQKWRHDPRSSPYFQPPIGTYYKTVMDQKSMALSDADRVAASKSVGW